MIDALLGLIAIAVCWLPLPVAALRGEPIAHVRILLVWAAIGSGVCLIFSHGLRDVNSSAFGICDAISIVQIVGMFRRPSRQ